jgi:selenocysteine-specific elongation factor
VPAASAPVLEEAVERLVAAGRLRRAAGKVRVVDLARDHDRAREEERAAQALADTLRKAGLMPPDLGSLAPDHRQRRLLDRLIREGVAIRAVDKVQKRELVFHRDAIEAAQRQLAPHLAGAGMLVSEVGAKLGISRKFSVPLLEHLDSIRYTRRVADRRVLARPEEGG